MSRRSTFSARSQSTARENCGQPFVASPAGSASAVIAMSPSPSRKRVEMRRGDGLIGQDRHAPAMQQRPDLVARARQKPCADPHVVAPLTERHPDAVDHFRHVVSRMSGRADSASITFAAISSIE